MTSSAWIHPRAGRPAEPSDLVDVGRLVDAYADVHPDASVEGQRVRFGTSGHRGTSLAASFNEDHILAVAQAIIDYRAANGIDGPLFLGRDTHALSEPALTSALEVFAGNGATVLLDSGAGYTPTPALSHAILAHNRGRTSGLADGVALTPSHNPPGDGGIKYNPPDGGPAGADVTGVIQDRANSLLQAGLKGVRRIHDARARAADTTGTYDFVDAYVADLPAVVDLAAIRHEGLRIGADALGGASIEYWSHIGAVHGLDVTVINATADPTWRFMSLDWDGKIRMDCSSAHAMASLVSSRARYDIAFGNDADADRHGIVTPDAGLMSPNHYLAVAIDYLFRHRPDWSGQAGVGKTVVSSSIIDRVARGLGRRLIEFPVGFKWFVPGLREGSIGFAGEESAGASMLRQDGTVWTTDKDGIVLGLLAAEIAAATGQSPSEHYRGLTGRHGDPAFTRIDAPASWPERMRLASMTRDEILATELAGEPITEILTEAPGNGVSIGGIKVSTASGWFAARPSGTEDVYKIYVESFRGTEHLGQIQQDAMSMLARTLHKGD